MRPNKITVDQIIKIIAETGLPDSSIVSVSKKSSVNANTIYK